MFCQLLLNVMIVSTIHLYSVNGELKFNRTNEYGQPIGKDLSNWTAALYPNATILEGRTCRLELINATKHAKDLFDAFNQAADGRDFTYIDLKPFESAEDVCKFIEEAKKIDIQLFAIIDLETNKAQGWNGLLNILPNIGKIETGAVLSPLMRKTIRSTEAAFLLLKYVFDDLGYRRVEWRCDSLNDASVNAAKRFGFTFEGVFRQENVFKNRSIDTAWFSIIDEDWPKLKPAFEAWLSPDNFDADGKQLKSLASFREQ